MEVPKDELREVGEIWLGMELEMYMDEDVREFQLPETADEFVDGLNLDDDDESDGIYTIKEIKKDTVIVDGNHPFAGKDLTFDVTVVGIDQPSFSELESGYPDRDEYDDFGDFDGENEDFNDNNLNRRWR
jgi:FKBP-type peptidyl-prolyl cis-trans isomerase SlyD